MKLMSYYKVLLYSMFMFIGFPTNICAQHQFHSQELEESIRFWEAIQQSFDSKKKKEIALAALKSFPLQQDSIIFFHYRVSTKDTIKSDDVLQESLDWLIKRHKKTPEFDYKIDLKKQLIWFKIPLYLGHVGMNKIVAELRYRITCRDTEIIIEGKVNQYHIIGINGYKIIDNYTSPEKEFPANTEGKHKDEYAFAFICVHDFMNEETHKYIQFLNDHFVQYKDDDDW